MKPEIKSCFFEVAGITIRVESEFEPDIVGSKKELARFAVGGPGRDNVTIRHYFELPGLEDLDLGTEVYRKAPWSVWRKGDRWCYLGISAEPGDPELHRVAYFSSGYTQATIYSTPYHEKLAREEGFHSLSLLPTDQIWLIPLLADRDAVLLHSAGVILNGRGLLFAGRSEAGKSTTVTMLKEALSADAHNTLEILCDDRNIVRREADGWRLYGTWSHGDVPDVSPESAPLQAVLFLQKAGHSALVRMTDRKEIWFRLLTTLIKPMVTAEWWQKELDRLEQIINDVPCYTMFFDKGGDIVNGLVELTRTGKTVRTGGRQ